MAVFLAGVAAGLVVATAVFWFGLMPLINERKRDADEEV